MPRRPKIAVISPLLPIRPGSHRGHSLYETTKLFSQWAEVKAFCPVTVYPKYLEPRSYTYLRPQPGFSPPGLDVTFLEYSVVPVLSRPINGLLCHRVLNPHVV